MKIVQRYKPYQPGFYFVSQMHNLAGDAGYINSSAQRHLNQHLRRSPARLMVPKNMLSLEIVCFVRVYERRGDVGKFTSVF